MLTIMQIITHIVHTEGWQYTQPFACSLQCRMFQQVALKAAALWTTITTGNTKRNVQHKKAFVLTHVCIFPYPALKSHYLIYSVIVYCYYSTKTCKEKIKMSNVKARKALMSKIYSCGLRLIMGIFQGEVYRTDLYLSIRCNPQPQYKYRIYMSTLIPMNIWWNVP